MIAKVVIVLFLVAILFCLGSAAYYLTSRNKDPVKMARALTARIVLSLVLFIFLMLGFMTGIIKPHQFQLFVPAAQVQNH